MSIKQRFWVKVDTRGPDECWPWTGSLTPLGYGQIRIKGKMWMAHRASWRLAHGPIPKGQCVCHSCDNPPCVNPAHLFLGTRAANSKDMVDKGRSTARLSDAKVKLIRRLYATGHYTQAELADRFGVSQTHVSGVVRGSARKHVAGRRTRARITLTQEQAEDIRQRVAAGERQVDVARDLGISKAAVSLIVRGLRH